MIASASSSDVASGGGVGGASFLLDALTFGYNSYKQSAAKAGEQRLNNAQYRLIQEEVAKGGTIDQAIATLRGFSAERTKFYGNEIGRKTGLDLYDVNQKTQALRAKSGFSGSGAIDRLEGATLDEVLGNAFSSMYEMQLGERMKMYEQESALEGQRRSYQVQQAGMDVKGATAPEDYSAIMATPALRNNPWIRESMIHSGYDVDTEYPV
jgi:tRNA A37 N6-isopentenylltransferase MiaA